MNNIKTESDNRKIDPNIDSHIYAIGTFIIHCNITHLIKDGYERYIIWELLNIIKLILLTKAIGTCPALCHWRRPIITKRFPTCRLSAVGSKPAYIHWGSVFSVSRACVLN